MLYLVIKSLPDPQNYPNMKEIFNFKCNIMGTKQKLCEY